MDKPATISQLSCVRKVANEAIPEDVVDSRTVQNAHEKLLTELKLVDELQVYKETDTPPLYLYRAVIDYYEWIAETRGNKTN
jgi:hypothetical protein